MRHYLLLACLASLLPCASPAAAQSFPSRPIRVIVPFEAGGAMDVVIRVIGKRVADEGGPQIVVENKTGAGGAIGVMAVRDAAPDGYTLAEVSSSTHVLNPHTTATIPYDPVKDFEPVAMLVRLPTLLTVPNALPAKSLTELLALARKNPNGLSYGSAGVGSAPHITGALLAKATGVPMTHIPYRGMAGAMNDVIGGRIDFVFSSIASLGGTVQDGKVRVLAVAGGQRLKEYPDVPSMAELGFPAVDVDLWFGIVAPSGTSPEVVGKLNAMFVSATKAPELAEHLAKLGAAVATSTPAGFRQALEEDNKRLGPFIRELTAKSN